MHKGQGGGRGRDAAEELVLRVVAEHADSLLRAARQHSICPDDAQDAYQRTLEIFMARADRLDPARVVGWLHVVVKHEAQAISRSRRKLLGASEIDPDSQEARRLPSLDDRVVSKDVVSRAAEALQRLKPQELRAVWLKAEGHSYNEIAALTGWSYTKVNRCLTEGRRRFLERFEAIESGAECERWLPIISAVVDGEASSAEILELRPHLVQAAAPAVGLDLAAGLFEAVLADDLDQRRRPEVVVVDDRLGQVGDTLLLAGVVGHEAGEPARRRRVVRQLALDGREVARLARRDVAVQPALDRQQRLLELVGEAQRLLGAERDARGVTLSRHRDDQGHERRPEQNRCGRAERHNLGRDLGPEASSQHGASSAEGLVELYPGLRARVRGYAVSDASAAETVRTVIADSRIASICSANAAAVTSPLSGGSPLPSDRTPW